MTDKEREIMRLMYELEVDMVKHQGEQIEGLEQAIHGASKAIDSLKRSHEILGKLMKATGDLMGVN